MGDKPGVAPIHFLVVDDDADSRATVVEYLRVLGFTRVTLAHDGTDAIRILERDQTINFIISDWDMPMMNGLALLRKVKYNPSRAHIPFMVMTSPISEEAGKVVLAAESMVDGYLIKPFRSQLLQDKIQKILTVSSMGYKKQVVVVDDSNEAREAIEEYLKQIGFRNIIGFGSPTNALTYIQTSAAEIGMIISDWEMPEITGIELLRTCKNTKELSEIPFIMVTSQTSIEKMKIMQAAQANVDQYMLKPFNLNEFRERIGEAIGKAKSFSEVKRLTQEGTDSLENGHFQTALTKFEDALKLQPDCEGALRGIAEAVVNLKGLQAAVPYYKKAIEVNPLYSRTYIELAKVFEQLNQNDRAVNLLVSGNNQIGFNYELRFALGKAYFRSGLLTEARVEFEKVLEIQPNHPETVMLIEKIDSETKGSQE